MLREAKSKGVFAVRLPFCSGLTNYLNSTSVANFQREGKEKKKW